MNKKNLISIFIILICVLFISSGVFAANPGQKGAIPAGAKTLKGDITDLKITDVIALKYPSPKDITLGNTTNKYCGEITVKTNIKSSNDAWAIGIVISAPLERKSYYPEYMDELYISNSTVGKGVFSVKKNSYYYSPGSETNEFKSYIYSSSELCKYNSLDVYVFKPYLTALGNQDQVQVYYTQIINGNQITNLSKGKIGSYDLKDYAGYLYHKDKYLDGIPRAPVYFYNADYAYGVTFSVGTTTTPVDCSTKCSGYTKSTTYPTSAVTVGGQSLSKGQVCYKCNDSGAMADRCNPFNGQKSGFTLNLTNYPDLKREICPNAGTTNTNSGSGTTSAQNTDTGGGSESQQVAASECSSDYNITYELYPNKKFKCIIEGTIPKYQHCSVVNGNVVISSTLTFENNSDEFKLKVCSSITQTTSSSIQTSSPPLATLNIVNDIEKNISDINFSLNNTNWYMVNKMDIPKEFLLNNKTQDKSLSIDLNMFREGTVYAIIATTDKKTEIDTELQNIYQTGVFNNNYVDQTTSIFNIDSTFTGFKPLKYILNNNNKNIKLNIKSQNTKNNLVIIFMQKSEDNSKVNLSYANLYVLDNKELSQYNFCIINRNIVNFYCKGHNCNSTVSCLKYGRWDFDPKIFEGLTGKAVEPVTPTQPVVQPPTIENPPAQTQSTFTGNCSIDKQATVEEYITCLRNNIEIFDIKTSRYTYSGSGGTGEQLMNIKYNDSSHCYLDAGFNDLIFSTAKRLNLTEEETAQLWARIAAESGCSLSCGRGSDCGSDGIGQIMVSVWTSEYSRLKSQLLLINATKYSTESKYKTELNNSRTDHETSLEISTAINRMNLANVINSSRNATRPITNLMYTTYDHDDSIDVKFISSYLYCSPNYSFFNGGILKVYKNEGCAYTAFHKMGYYLAYKRMIYNCHKTTTTNAFVNAYKTKYTGTYCK